MVIEWDVPITMDDGVVLRADVFRPEGGTPCPVILSYGPYAKGLTFQEGYPDSWRILVEGHPEVMDGSTGAYQAWEVVDPEKWVPDGYACVRVDARGFGRSPGFADPWSPRETRDLHDCIEWAGTSGWSNGRVGLCGISYFAMNQWLVAATQPPHLAAIVPWEGLSDHYRDFWYHGGIRATSPVTWHTRVIETVQHGLGKRGATNPNTGELACGPGTLTDEELAANRADWLGARRAQPLDGPFWADYRVDGPRVTVPLLSAGNWGGAGMHLRGNVEGFTAAASDQKWLEMHTREHWTEFYTDHGVELQKAFLDHFLKGEDNGWDRRPRVTLRIRTVGDGFTERSGDAWPLPGTEWRRLYLDPAGGRLLDEPPAEVSSVSFEALGDGLTFSTPPLTSPFTFAGPVAAKLFIDSSTTDADLFLVLRVFDPEGEEVVFKGAVDPHTPVGQGWLRASHRKLDPARSRPERPWHTHDEPSPLTPGVAEELDVELWPASLVVPAGYRIALSVRGRDYEYEGSGEVAQLSHFKGSAMRGCGIYLHDDEQDRPVAIYGGTTTVHTAPGRPSFLFLPGLPESEATS